MAEKTYTSDKVCVAIPAYNEERFLREALDSVVNQVDCVILSDNASTDGTEAICREYAAKYSHVKYFRQDENIGSLRNMQFCFQQVEAEFVFHMGSHDLVPPNYVAALKAELANHPDYVGAYADSDYIEIDGTLRLESPQFSKCVDKKSNKSFPELLESDYAHERGTILLQPINFFNLIFGLFRSKQCIPIWLNARPIWSCDFVLLLEMILTGKLCYCTTTQFVCRIAHPADTPSDYLIRITGESDAMIDMARVQAVRVNELIREIKEVFQRVPCDPAFARENQRLCRDAVLWWGNTYDVPTGFLFTDMYRSLKRLRKSICQVRFGKKESHITLFGINIYSRTHCPKPQRERSKQ